MSVRATVNVGVTNVPSTPNQVPDMSHTAQNDVPDVNVYNVFGSIHD